MYNINEEYITPKQFSAIVGVHLRTVYRWIKNGDLPCKKWRKNLYISIKEIER